MCGCSSFCIFDYHDVRKYRPSRKNRSGACKYPVSRKYRAKSACDWLLFLAAADICGHWQGLATEKTSHLAK